MDQSCFDIIHLPKDSRAATKYVVEMLLENVHPLLRKIRNRLHCKQDVVMNGEHVLIKLQDVYSLCSSQIKKCVFNLLEVFKHEHKQHIYLQDSRQCILERLICCFEKLYCIEERLEEPLDTSGLADDSLLFTTMYFVNWIDQTFEILNKLSSLVYRTNIKESEQIYDEWKIEVLGSIIGLHSSVDELLLSAMTLCRYCLSSDQPVIKVRCQVVLRETKALIGELIEGDLDSVVHATKESLKLPIMPSNANLLIDVLKDVLYVLETNTNTALLALLVHCFSYSASPVDRLRSHLKGKVNNMCPCGVRWEQVAEGCVLVKEFDLYNERLMQIGSFAISCSSDEKRVLSLKSGLASLEALDPHLVPALQLAPDSTAAALLAQAWDQELSEIKNNVFLIVDPAAFSDRVQQMMRQVLLDVTKQSRYSNQAVCSIVDMGSTVCSLFHAYYTAEPDALHHHTLLQPLINNLNKVVLECKVVSDMLSSSGDALYGVNKPKSLKDVTFGQLQKRLKLLYTLVTKVNTLLSPKEDPQFYEDEEVGNKNVTKTLFGNGVTSSPRRIEVERNRSIFSRTVNIRSSTAKFPLALLTRNTRMKQKDLSFSVKLDEMCDVSTIQSKQTSILYHSINKTRSSLRRAVLNRQCMAEYENRENKNGDDFCEQTDDNEQENFIDGSMSLQITDVLNQINELTNISMAPTTQNRNSSNAANTEETDTDNVLRININNTTMKSADNSGGLGCDVTQPSDVSTLQRINDLELVEDKLNKLLTLEMETSL